jgi:hypothetical protein
LSIFLVIDEADTNVLSLGERLRRKDGHDLMTAKLGGIVVEQYAFHADLFRMRRL